MKFDSLFRWIPGQKKRRILLLHNPESRFTEIFSTNYWGSAESKSGFGSSLKATTQIRRELPEIFQKYQIRNVFDAPCGDFHWMQHVVRETSINYIGGDIVEPLINENTERFGSLNINFHKFDITMDRFPKADLWLCRHCLFHLSYADIAAALKRFLASDIPLIATTSHLFKDQKIVNSDIATGDFRMIDLFSEPFNFPQNYIYSSEDYVPPDCPMGLYFWRKDQLEIAIADFSSRVTESNLPSKTA